MRMRKALRKIHRWTGLLSALWLLQLAMTGLLLQHADDLKLTQTHVSSPTVLKWFGYAKNHQIWYSGEQAIYQVDDVVGFNDVKANIAAPLVGVVRSQNQWLVATSDSVYRFNQQGEIIQQLDDYDGVPTPINQLIINKQGDVDIQVEEQWYTLQASGDFIATQQTFNKPIQARPMTASEQSQYLSQALQGKLSYDKVLHGIHAGIQGSKWLNSLSALALIFLCFSGIFLFFKQPKNKRR